MLAFRRQPTPGAVAGNELLLAEKQKDATDSLVESRSAAVRAARAKMTASGDMESYLRVRAPFDGTITDRFVHPGMRVDDNGQTPLLRLQQTTHLRLVVPVPEGYVGSIVKGRSVSFQVPAHPGKNYTGKITRVANALDPQSRTMMVELDVSGVRTSRRVCIQRWNGRLVQTTLLFLFPLRAW